MNLSYELANKLKEAGFPQKPDMRWVCISTTDCDWWCNRCHKGEKKVVNTSIPKSCPYDCKPYIPTLEELIEACGEEFGGLENTFDGWRAYASSRSRDNSKTYWSKTLEGAVSKLYLALYSKDV